MKLYVGNLSYEVDDSSLEELFSPFGSIASAKVIRDRDSGNSRGFGFVEIESEESANNAIQELNGTDFSGRSLVVNAAREKAPRDGGGRY